MCIALLYSYTKYDKLIKLVVDLIVNAVFIVKVMRFWTISSKMSPNLPIRYSYTLYNKKYGWIAQQEVSTANPGIMHPGI
jgi:hypothetical protein